MMLVVVCAKVLRLNLCTAAISGSLYAVFFFFFASTTMNKKPQRHAIMRVMCLQVPVLRCMKSLT